MALVVQFERVIGWEGDFVVGDRKLLDDLGARVYATDPIHEETAPWRCATAFGKHNLPRIKKRGWPRLVILDSLAALLKEAGLDGSGHNNLLDKTEAGADQAESYANKYQTSCQANSRWALVRRKKGTKRRRRSRCRPHRSNHRQNTRPHGQG
jgi:hypothetical protein